MSGRSYRVRQALAAGAVMSCGVGAFAGLLVGAALFIFSGIVSRLPGGGGPSASPLTASVQAAFVVACVGLLITLYMAVRSWFVVPTTGVAAAAGREVVVQRFERSHEA